MCSVVSGLLRHHCNVLLGVVLNRSLQERCGLSIPYSEKINKKGRQERSSKMTLAERLDKFRFFSLEKIA